MKIIDKLYEFVITIQIVLMFLFIMSNFESLASIPYSIDITETITFSFTLNFYILISVIIGIYVASIAVGIQVVSSGLNDEGTKNVGKLIGFVVIWLILTIGSNYYFTFLEYSILLNLVITVIHGLKMTTLLLGGYE